MIRPKLIAQGDTEQANWPRGITVIVEYIRYSIDEGRAKAFEEAYLRAGESLRASEHCERYEVSRCSEDPTQRVVRIEWDPKRGISRGSARAPTFAPSSKPSGRSSTTSKRCVTTR